MRIRTVILCAACIVTPAHLTIQAQTNASAIEAETLQHFQALLRIDTSSPPGNETRAVEYLKQAFDKEGIPYQSVRSRQSAVKSLSLQFAAQSRVHRLTGE